MTHTLVLLAPVLALAGQAPKAGSITLDKRKQVVVFGGDCRVGRTRAELRIEIVGQRPRTNYQRVRQLHSQIGRAEIHLSSSPFGLPLDAPLPFGSKAGTVMPASCW